MFPLILVQLHLHLWEITISVSLALLEAFNLDCGTWMTLCGTHKVVQVLAVIVVDNGSLGQKSVMWECAHPCGILMVELQSGWNSCLWLFHLNWLTGGEAGDHWLPVNRAMCPSTNYNTNTGVVGRYGVISSVTLRSMYHAVSSSPALSPLVSWVEVK